MAELKTMAAQPVQAPVVKTQTLWPIIGAAWKNTDKKGRELLSVVIGNRRAPFSELTLKPEDKLMLRPNSKRPGKKDADYQVCLAQ